MTDTTDTAALRELLCHEDFESDYHVGVTVTTLRLLLSKADQLEAERQRADYAVKVKDNDEQTALYWAKIAAEALAEIAALKGDQVPVGTWCIQEVIDDDGSLSRTEFLSVADGVKIPKDAQLFTAPQKPVLLPVEKVKHWREAPCNGVDWAKGWKEGWNACVKQIEAAGGIVKSDHSGDGDDKVGE